MKIADTEIAALFHQSNEIEINRIGRSRAAIAPSAGGDGLHRVVSASL